VIDHIVKQYGEYLHIFFCYHMASSDLVHWSTVWWILVCLFLLQLAASDRLHRQTVRWVPEWWVKSEQKNDSRHTCTLLSLFHLTQWPRVSTTHQ